ncbi:hypothetical protein H8959_003250 [Pygathrix nigripes]
MFVLLGLSDEKELQLILFPVFLVIYRVTLIWNMGLIILIRIDCHLHTPMSFFLSFLSFIDICYSSTISPRILSDILKDKKTISFLACATQYFVGAWMSLAECCLLVFMACDRHVPIGSPLQYSAIMVPASMLKISSTKGRAKAFNTCASHLAAVALFYGTTISVYMHPSSSHSMKQDKVFSVFYVILIPMLNPLIYSLRNKEIKEALRRVINEATHLH